MTDTELLLEKYLNGTCTNEERKKVDAWFEAHEVENNAWENLSESDKAKWLSALFADTTAQIAEIETSENTKQTRSVMLWPKIAVAAAAVAAIVFGVYFYTYRGHEGKKDPVHYAGDIAPGNNGATIVLSNGQVIALSGKKKGVVIGRELKYTDSSPVISSEARNPLSSIDKRSLSKGRDDGNGEIGEVQNLTASTANGQTYEFTLPDGTHVWLNAASKISFPPQFNESERKIILSGEGYFEVAKDKAHPFVVITDRQTITVLGTHFNINSYDNEIVTTTTLLEGSVKIAAFDAASGRSNVVLKPNQQYLSNKDGGQLLEVNAGDAIAWKNGDFIFDDETLARIMNQIARWYDVTVIYEPGLDKTQTFGGKVSRNKNVSAVLNSMQSTGKVKFKISGKNITVLRP